LSTTIENFAYHHHNARYVKGIKILMALIRSTANNIKTTMANIIALIGDVAELT